MGRELHKDGPQKKGEIEIKLYMDYTVMYFYDVYILNDVNR